MTVIPYPYKLVLQKSVLSMDLSIKYLALINLVLTFTQQICAQKGSAHGQPQRAKVTTSQAWIEESLHAHNYFRSLHGSPPLVLNRTLSEISQHYANFLLQMNLDQAGNAKREIYFKHNPAIGPARLGENLYYSQMTSPIDPVPSPYAVLLWYEEIKDYNFSSALVKATSDPKAKIGHLTQILWKSTSQMGTAYASKKLASNQLLVFVVANYYQGGNILYNGGSRSLYFKNVLPANRSDADINAAIVKYNVESWYKEPNPTEDTPNSWRVDLMNRHNYYRKLHGSQQLRLNSQMCKTSQLWANYLLEKSLNDFNRYGILHQMEISFKGRQLCNFGEISMTFITPNQEKLSAKQIIDSWYKERDYYSLKTAKSPKSDRFQQLVWNATTEFCISYATREAENGQYVTFVTANYYPGLSHRIEDKKYNVFPRMDESASDGDSGSNGWIIFAVITCIGALISIMVVVLMKTTNAKVRKALGNIKI